MAIFKFDKNKIDTCLLDIMMPNKDAFANCVSGLFYQQFKEEIVLR